MEQHPIPQNVTGFQFKLVGDITLKQFAYLAGCALSAYIVTKISFIPDIFRYPLAGFLALLGIGLAFVPIEERPLDRWIGSFIKSIYSPTQFVYKKQNQPPLVLSQTFISTAPPIVPTVKPISPIIKQSYINSLPITGKTINKTVPTAVTKTAPITPLKQPAPAVLEMKKKPTSPVSWNLGAPPVAPKIIGNYQNSPSLTGKKMETDKEVPDKSKNTTAPAAPDTTKIKTQYQQMNQKLTDQIQSLQKELSEGTIAKERLIEIQQVLTMLLAEKERLSMELIRVQKQLLQKEVGTVEKPTTYTSADDSRSTVKMVAPGSAARVGLPRLTNQPNVITGVIKTSQGPLLPNIIVTVKDKEGVPVRALKTNRLGQFAASTPLPEGTYIIEVEDPKKAYQFHRIEVALTNVVLPPLEISAVSERDIVRQKLTQELFGKNKI